MLTLLPFQRAVVSALESGRYDTVVLSVPRGQGKSSLAAELCWRSLTPGDRLYREGTESLLVAQTITASRRTCFKLLRRLVEESPVAGDYSISESLNDCHVRRKACNTRVAVAAATSKSTLGLVGVPLVVMDEPGTYDLLGGQALWDAISTAQGKVGSPLTAFLIGHLAPRAHAPGHWYYDLVERGTHGRTYVSAIRGNAEKWDRASEIRRCNPLSWRDTTSRNKLFEQRDEALGEANAKAAFLSYRLNIPTPSDEVSVLTPHDWSTVLARAAAPRGEERPVVGVDLGQGRAWSAAVALWPESLRVEAVAYAPGIPDLAAQERRDKAVPHTYRLLAERGCLRVAEGLHVPPVGDILRWIETHWKPRLIVMDRFRAPELIDQRPKCRVQSRAALPSERTADVRALRALARDDCMSVDAEAAPLLTTSLRVSRLTSAPRGNIDWVSRPNNCARDDVAQALVLAAGVVHRYRERRRARAA